MRLVLHGAQLGFGPQFCGLECLLGADYVDVQLVVLADQTLVLGLERLQLEVKKNLPPTS